MYSSSLLFARLDFAMKFTLGIVGFSVILYVVPTDGHVVVKSPENSIKCKHICFEINSEFSISK